MNKLEVLVKTEEQINENIVAYNKALSEGNFKTMNDLDIKLKDLETTYSKTMAKVVYDDCLTQENPIEYAILKYAYNVITHRDEKEEGVVIKRVMSNEKSRQIDLFKLCEYSKQNKVDKPLDIKWVYNIEKLNQLLTMRTARDLGYTTAEITSIENSYFMRDVAKQINLGETPDSDTQIAKLIQTCVDGILFKDNGKGKNSIKVLNRDAKYLVALYARKGKSILSVQTAKHDFMRKLVVDIIYRILTDSHYTVEYKVKKAN